MKDTKKKNEFRSIRFIDATETKKDFPQVEGEVIITSENSVTTKKAFRHTDEINDIILSPPNWLMRFGISLFFLVLFIIIAFSALIKYPDIVNSKLNVYSNDPANIIYSPVNGILTEINVADNAVVNSGQNLGNISNNYENIKIVAAQSGNLNYTKVLSKGQQLLKNEKIFVINILERHFWGQIYIPPHDRAKVKAGQRVILKFNSFPYEEFGVVYGRIDYIINLPDKDLGVAKVSFEPQKNNEKTQRIHLANGMTADAEIITQDATILQRIVRNLSKVLH